MSLSEMQEMLAALETALYQGVLEVRYADKWIKYQSTDSMFKAVRDLKQRIAHAERRPSYGFYRIDINKGKGGS